MSALNLTPAEAAARLRHSPGTLSNWRIKGGGPKYIKFGRRVLYPLVEIEAFERDRTIANTSQQPE